MKLENKYIEVEGGIGEESYDASISQADMHKMWDMLQNPYKNSIGSIVREVTSNCFDSHTEAKITDAVRIKFGKEDSGFYVSFIDVGVGLSPQRIQDIFLKYLKSTKELSNEFIGAFGQPRPI
jgi:DNA topoisomerase VI subunit B